MVGAADDDLEAGDALASCQSLLSERCLEHGAPPRSDRSNSGSSKRAGRKHATFAASSSSITTSSSTAVVQKISTAAVVVHLVKGNIGPGAMSLPSGFSKVGIVAGPIMFVLVVRLRLSVLMVWTVELNDVLEIRRRSCRCTTWTCC